MKKISYVFLTWGRKPSVEKALTNNLEHSGYDGEIELVHVDNGSGDEFCQWFKETFNPSIQIRYKENVGLYRGYNVGFAVSTGELIALTDCDILMPKNWLSEMVRAHETIPDTGSVFCLAQDPHLMQTYENRMRGDAFQMNGITIRKCYPHGPRVFSRQFLKDVGYFHEGFSPYGLGDLAWTERVQKVSAENGYMNYVLPELGFGIHLPDHDFEHGDYAAFKAKAREGKKELLVRLREEGLKPFNPF